MPDLTPCEELLSAENASAELLRRAAASEECLPILLASARERLSSAPVDALRYARFAVALTELQNDFQTCAQARRIEAQALRAQGDHTQAIKAFDDAARCAARAENALLAAQVQIGKVDSLIWLGDYIGALTLAISLQAQFEELGASEDAAKVLVNQGNLHLRRDQYPEALGCFDRAQVLLAECDDPTALARVQFNMATTLMEVNRMEEALSLFDSARTVFAAQNMTGILAMVDANRGFLLALSGRPASAITALSRAHDEFTARGQSWEAAKCDADRAESYQELNLHAEALDCYDRAITQFESQGIVYERARAEAGRAGVLMASQRNVEALEALSRAENLFQFQRNTTRLAHVRLLRAGLLQRQGQSDEAQLEVRRAASSLCRKGKHGWAAEARFLALEWDASAESTETEILAQQIRALIGIRRTARKWARGWLECRAEQALGHCYLRRQDVTRALKHFRAGITVLEQARTAIVPETMHVAYLRDKLSIYEDITAVLLERGRPRDIAEALEYVERAKSRLLLERIQQTLEGKTTDADLPLQTQEQLAGLRAELNRIYHQLHTLDDSTARRFGVTETTDKDAALYLYQVEEAYRRALNAAEVSRPAVEFRTLALPKVPALSVLQRALQSDEALVEFSFVHNQVCAFVVRSHSVEFHRLASVDAIRHTVRRLRHQLERVAWTNAYTHQHAQRFLTDIQNVLGNLYDLLWRPLQMALPVEKVVVIPHGELHGLPFHALFNGTDYALDHWEFVYAPSAAFWCANRQRGQNTTEEQMQANCLRSSLLIGIPEPGIERVASEVEMLASLLPQSKTLCRAEATVERVQALAPECRIFHIATHALYRADNPLFSGLRLSDGWLLARDLYQMSLNCDLATLSACQTGAAFVEAGDELFGLVRGFLSAGARSVAASLWSADDKATAALMEPFYTLMMQGKSCASALREAQKILRSEHAHPYYWAAFALFGARGN